MKATFKTERRVEFADTDLAGIAHFTAFYRYMEEAEHAFLRDRGLSVILQDDRGKLGFPKLSATCNYQRPARYDDVLDVTLRAACLDGKSIIYECDFAHQATKVAEGKLQVAFCRFPAETSPYPVPIWDHVLHQLFGSEPERTP